jgi:hypothetical protein
MTVEPSWRHVDGMSNDWEEHAELDKHTETTGSYELRISVAKDSMPDGVIVVRNFGGDIDSFMVPDPRLQAIADAPKCEHGKVYRHIVDTTIVQTPNPPGYDKIDFDVCEGSPELADLLDALTKEDKE